MKWIGTFRWSGGAYYDARGRRTWLRGAEEDSEVEAATDAEARAAMRADIVTRQLPSADRAVLIRCEQA